MTFSPALAPDAAALLTALGQLGDASAARTAALHLATPVTAAVGVEVRDVGDAVTFRGHRVVMPATAGDSEVAAAAAQLAAVAHRPGDRYLDLGVDITVAPQAWAKVLRSGCRRVAFGVDALYGAPVTFLDDSAADGALTVWLAAWSAGPVSALPVVLPGDVLVDGTTGRVVLRGLASGTVPASTDPVPVAEPVAVAARVGRRLGARSVTWRSSGSRAAGTADFEGVAMLPGRFEAVFPFTLGPGTELVGAPTATPLDPVEAPGTVPEGFEALGMVPGAGQVVARHAQSGLVVALRDRDGRR